MENRAISFVKIEVGNMMLHNKNIKHYQEQNSVFMVVSMKTVFPIISYEDLCRYGRSIGHKKGH